MPIVPVNRPKPLPPKPAAEDDQPYEVGYGKPPRQSRFQPGKSGNPKGRPKNAKGFKTIIRAAMLQKVRVRSGGKERTISRAEALVMKVVELASKDNFKATEKLLIWYQEAVPESSVEGPRVSREVLSETDHATLDALRDRIKADLIATGVPMKTGGDDDGE